MALDREKLKAVILHVCSKCDASQLGAVKLHKVLYFSDMIHFVVAGAPITGAIYRKRPFGPTCDSLLHALRELEQENAIRIVSSDYFGYQKKDYILLNGSRDGMLSNLELGLLDEVIEFVCFNNTAKTISEFSHMKPWEMVEFGEEIPYHSALSLIPSQVSLDAKHAALSERNAIEAERSQFKVMDYQTFSAFRSRVLPMRA